jgi:hypothetical protein
MELLLNTVLGRLSSLKSLTLVPRASSYANSIHDPGTTGMIISGGLCSLLSAPGLLQSLEISPWIYIFLCPPKWIGQLHNLCILKFGVIKIDRDDVNVLRGLPALAVLSLYVQTKPAERVVIGKTGFPVIKYFRFKCCGPWLKFEEGAMPNLRKLKLAFNACNPVELITIPVGIRYLSNLKEVSAKIGGASPDESHRKARATELALRDEIRVHGRCQRVNIQCVKQIIGGKDDQSYITTVEDHVTLKLKQNKIKDEDEENSIEQVEITKDHSRAHQFSLPKTKTSSETAAVAVDKLLHFHDALPLKTTTHPRSIAERVSELDRNSNHVLLVIS